MMRRCHSQEKIRLSGFNNLTKCLSFNLYDFCTAASDEERLAYIKYVNETYNAEAITKILNGIANIIEAKVLAVSDQDYDPWGASSLVLLSDIKGGGVDNESLTYAEALTRQSQQGSRTQVKMHLDKSHICAHTYPDFLHSGEVCSLRVDIDIATCGQISPLKALNYMFEKLESDVVVIDYVVRGFTRDAEGRRIYMDHPLQSIQDYIDPKILEDYYCLDLALQRDLIWQTKMLRTRINPQEYFVTPFREDDPDCVRRLKKVKQEMRDVLHMFPED